MSIVSFSFTKINVERKQDYSGRINVANNISIKNIEQKNLPLGGSKQSSLRCTFEFITKYMAEDKKEVGSILLEGDVIYLEELAKIKKLLTDWEKERKLPKEMMTHILNTALSKCNIHALTLSDSINMPPPMPLPRVQVNLENKN